MQSIHKHYKVDANTQENVQRCLCDILNKKKSVRGTLIKTKPRTVVYYHGQSHLVYATCPKSHRVNKPEDMNAIKKNKYFNKVKKDRCLTQKKSIFKYMTDPNNTTSKYLYNKNCKIDILSHDHAQNFTINKL